MSISASSRSIRSPLNRTLSRIDGNHSEQAGDQPPVVRRRSRIPWGLAGMIGLVVTIESLFAARWLTFSDPVSLSWRFSVEAARTEAPRSELLCLGDSLAKHGVIPSLIEAESGLRTVNLAAARCPTVMTYFVLRRALDAGARPAAIVINTKQAVLLGNPDFNAQYWPAVLSPRECLELGVISRRPETAAAALVGCLLPSLRGRLEIRSNLLAALGGHADPLPGINRLLWRNWTVNGGANVASLDSRYQGELPPAVEKKLHPSGFFVDPSNAEGLERTLRLAAGRNIRVFWLLPPISDGLEALRNRSGSETQFEKWVRSFQSKYPRIVTVLDARKVVSDPAMFIDATHLSGRGAIALSHSLGRVLAAELTRPAPPPEPRWVVLEASNEDPHAEIALPIEDIDQSKRILRLDVDSDQTIR
jgi:hypothetical protein